MHPISRFCIDNFRISALVINMSERVATILEKMYPLFDLQKNEEKDAPPANAISSDESHDAQILERTNPLRNNVRGN